MVQQHECRFRLALEKYDELEGVLAALRTAGVRIQEMEVVHPDLEEVFVKIMHTDGRDERRETRDEEILDFEGEAGAK
jgi:hypothetical protein